MTKTLEQSVRVVEGKPVYLTEEQWDWLYDYFLDAKEDIMFFCNWKGDLLDTNETQYGIELKNWLNSLSEYLTLFEKDIDSFFKTSETFTCVGCNKELEKYHMRVSAWSRNLADESDESALLLVLDQKRDCIGILKDQIYDLKTNGWFSCDPLRWDMEQVLMLLRNAYRILRGIPLGHPVFFDPYTIEILYGLLKSYDNCDDIKTIVEMIDEDTMPQMKKPLCGSCAGDGLCILCNEPHTDGELPYNEDR